MKDNIPSQKEFNKTCIIIAGPTAVGKTSFAIQLAQHLKTAIISADSRQCFKELNIGVAKPTALELQLVPHHFINTHSVDEDVNAVVFEQYALNKISEIFKQQDTAVMVGGTGLYIKAFCEGIDELPHIDAALRNSLIADYAKNGLEWLQKQIKKNDPAYFATGEIKNPQRLIRALEVKTATGKSITSFQTRQKKQRDFKIIKIGLQLPKEKLLQNINNRVDEMITKGLIEEVKKLEPYKKFNALQTVGYKELFEYLSGEIKLEAAIERIKINTRQYAKRQLTWFKKDLEMKWVVPDFPLSSLMEDILWES